jgi:pilus assembly protein CpaF
MWDQYTRVITTAQQDELIESAVKHLEGLSLVEIRDRALLARHAQEAVQLALRGIEGTAPPHLVAAMTQQVIARVGGFGFLDEFLPPARNDLSEIALNPDGSLWILAKGTEHFEQINHASGRPADGKLPLGEVWRSVETLIAPLGRAVSESTPSVDAKLPRKSLSPDFGGARVKILHPVIAPGDGYPSINIRLFEPKPVIPEQIVTWKMAPEAVIHDLVQMVARKLRLLLIGGTATGKTTLLAALCAGIPKDARVVKIEDPEEIWIDHPNVVTIEARPSPPGSSIPAYTLKDGVDDAMRMNPRWLVVGEVRHGDAGLALFRAQMSDHPGLSTFHAEGPEEALFRMAVILFADTGVRMEAAKAIFAQAVDLVVQVGWLESRRQILGVWEVAPTLKGGNVSFSQLYRPGDTGLTEIKRRR